jgi:hypothetical protein
MFSICRSNQTRRALACLAAVLLGVAACSRERDAAPAAPLVELQSSTPDAPAGDVLASEITAGGIHARYRATFTENQLRRIGETRIANPPTGGENNYEFQGARLMSYVGAPLSGAGPIEIRFNLQGVVTRSRAPAGEVAPEEIAAIRARAQLLRSHALAQRAARAHETR